MARKKSGGKKGKGSRSSKAFKRATDAVLSKMRKRVSKCIHRCAGIGRRRASKK